MKIRATLHCMAESEIANMIPFGVMADIKRVDPKPLFKVFVVGHEGEARGNMLGVGNIVKKWYRTMVEKLHEKIAVGLQLFHGHGVTNEHDGRLTIGRVVGKALKEISGRLSTVVACYIDRDYRHIPLDVASIEAQIDMIAGAGGELEVVDVADVSAIALGNHAVEQPGFPGATLLGQLQAFVEENKINIGYEKPESIKLGFAINKSGLSSLTFDEHRRRDA